MKNHFKYNIYFNRQNEFINTFKVVLSIINSKKIENIIY